MCTVTVVLAHGNALVRLVCNRDEKRTRSPAFPPQQRTLGDRRAIMPIDPQSNGTWIGANDAGVVACLLNAAPAGVPHTWPDRLSRGEIVPSLLTADCIEAALATSLAIDPSHFPPFRALVLSRQAHFVLSSDGTSARCSDPSPLLAPLMLTSSSLGDQQVELPRRVLFNDFVHGASDQLRAQALFHALARPERSQLGVLMSRPDARTVSRTVADIRADSIELRHTRLNDALAPDGPESRLCVHRATAEIAA